MLEQTRFAWKDGQVYAEAFQLIAAHNVPSFRGSTVSPSSMSDIIADQHRSVGEKILFNPWGFIKPIISTQTFKLEGSSTLLGDLLSRVFLTTRTPALFKLASRLCEL